MKFDRSAHITIASFCVMLATAFAGEAMFFVDRPLAFSAILIAALTALTWFDLRYMILPNLITLPLICVGLVWTWWSHGSWINALAGMAIGYLGVRALNLAWQARKGQDGIGQGDAKLLAAAGAWLGGLALAPIVLIGSVSALIVLFVSGRGRLPAGNTRIPFGPFLALGFWANWTLPIADWLAH